MESYPHREAMNSVSFRFGDFIHSGKKTELDIQLMLGLGKDILKGFKWIEWGIVRYSKMPIGNRLENRDLYYLKLLKIFRVFFHKVPT